MKRVLLLLALVAVVVSGYSRSEESTTRSGYTNESMNGKRIAALVGSTSDFYATENFPDSEIVRISSVGDYYPMLKSNQVDYIIADTQQIQEMQKTAPDLVIGDPELYAIGVAVVFPKTEGDLRDEVNEFFARFRQSDTYKDMYDRWIVRGDYSSLPDIEIHTSGPKIVVATDPNNFPCTAIVNGRLDGFEVELLRWFAADRGYQLEWMSMDFPAVVGALASHKVNAAVSSICVTEERKKSFLFSDEYFSIPSGSAYLVKSAERYRNYTHPTEVIASKVGERPNVDDSVRCYVGSGIVAAVEGTVQEQYVSSILPSSQVAINKDYSDALLTMVSGKAQFMLTNLGTANAFRKAQESVEIVLQDIFTFDTCYGVSKSNGELKGEIDEFLERKRADGTLDKLFDKWLTDLDEAEFTEVEYAPGAPVLKVGSGCTAVPFSFISNGRAVGLDIDVLALFCQDAGYRLEVIEMPFGALVSAITTGKVDLIANTLSATPERLKTIDFTLPYGHNCFALIYNRESLILDGDDEERLGFFGSIKESFVRNVITERRYLMILDGLWVTVIISLLSIILGTIVGGAVCSLTMSRSKLLSSIGDIYVTIIRGTPVLVILMINFYVIFAQSAISPILVATISFAMNFGAYVSEMFRSSIESIDKGQSEAGLAMGFTKFKTFVLIIAPQAIRRVLPVFKGEAISLVKMTSIVGYIAVQDITKVGDIIRSRTFDAFFPLLVSALLYFLIAYLFSVALDLLTAKYTRSR